MKILLAGDVSNWKLGKSFKIPKLDLIKSENPDVYVYNLEGSIIPNNVEIAREFYVKSRLVRFLLGLMNKMQPAVNSDFNVLPLLKLGKVNVACLANNHMLDYGIKGLRHTQEFLKRNNIYFLGAGFNKNDAKQCIDINVDADKYLEIYNYNLIGWRYRNLFFNIFGATDKKPGCSSILLNKKNIGKFKKELSNKKKYATRILSLHCGKVFRGPSEVERNFLKEISGFFDVIMLHHAHMAGSIYKIGESSVCELGDFVFKYAKNKQKNFFCIFDTESKELKKIDI